MTASITRARREYKCGTCPGIILIGEACWSNRNMKGGRICRYCAWPTQYKRRGRHD